MNLGFEPWIPVTMTDGTQRSVSLAEVFREGHRIADLATRPHERIALMRLLVCVAQAALDGPEDEDDWPEAGARLPDAAAVYLEHWRDRFELFGEGPRFLQVRAEEMSEFEASKLLFERASGNNPTLFDHEGGSMRGLAPAELALALLCFQNMSASIGAGYTGKSPCLDRHFLQTWLIGGNLLETILANGVDRATVEQVFPAGFGRPVWESNLVFGDKQFERNTTLSFLGRLAPVTRQVWLNENGLSFELAKPGISHPTFEEYREAAATILTKAKKSGEERVLLGADLRKQPWRDLQHVVEARQNGKTNRPVPLQRSEVAPFRRLWLGALITDGKGKYEDAVEAVYDVPRELLKEDRQPVYAQGIEFADAWCTRLAKAVAAYAGQLQAKPDYARAERHFWNTLDQRVTELFDLVRDVARLNGKTFWQADVPWTRSVRRAAQDAYRFACPQATPRQIQAFAVGLGQLRPPKPPKETE
jgi:CRISPR system Cascade subunit CasA